MTINITNKEADRLTRQLAELEGIGISEAVIVAMREALERRRQNETVAETVTRLHTKYGIVLTDEMRKPLPRSIYDDMSGDM